MASQLGKSDPLRVNDDENKLEGRNQEKTREDDESNNETEVKSIINIYYDCLERIFDFLDLESLLNVADTCKRLQIAAAAKFSDQYGKRNICLNPFRHRFAREQVGIVRARLIGLKFCLPLLRCFGSKISSLDVDHIGAQETQEDAKVAAFLNQYINQYCAETLVSISFSGLVHFFSIENFEKPFKNVTKVSFYHINLKNQLPSFKNVIPNVRELELGWNAFIDETATDVFFPHLEYLWLSFGNGRYTNEGAAAFLRQNKQLHKLIIYAVYDPMTLTDLLDLINENRSIYELEIVTEQMDVQMVELNRLVTEHPSIVKLTFESYAFTADDAIFVIRQLNSLRHFELRINAISEYHRLLNQLGNDWQGELRYGNVYKLTHSSEIDSYNRWKAQQKRECQRLRNSIFGSL